MNTSIELGKPVKKRVEVKPGISRSAAAASSEVEAKQIEKIIKNALLHLPDLTTVAVVEIATGTCLAHRSRSRNFNHAAVAACHTEMVRQKQLAMAALNMRGERLQDLLIPFRKQMHLLRLARNGQWLVFLAVKAQDTSLALAREVLKSIVA